MKNINLQVKKSDLGLRLDYFLAKKIDNLSRSSVQKLIKIGKVLVNKKISKSSYLITLGDKITVKLSSPIKKKISSFDFKLDKIYEDNNILIINKPPGMIVYSEDSQGKETLIDIIFKKIKANSKKKLYRFGIVHRLDKDTSGILLIAKNEKSHNYLSKLFKERKIIKRYFALVKGHVKPTKGIIEAPISRSNKDKQKMIISLPDQGKEAQTKYKVIRYINNYTLLEIEPKTGRTHQIRVHLSSIGYSIVGDKKYGSRDIQNLSSRQFLHAFYIKFKLPSGEVKEFISDLPADLQNTLDKINKINS